MRTQKQKLSWFNLSVVVGLAIFALFGCGARSTPTGSTDSASSATSVSASGAVATCNRYTSTDGNLDYELKAYTDSSGVRNNSFIRLKFLRVPSQYASSNWDIHIKKFTVSATGTVSPSSTDLQKYANVRIDHKSSGVYNVASNWGYNQDCDTCPTLQWSNMQLIASAQSQSFSSATSFFSEYHLLLDLQEADNANPTWKYLQINMVDGNGVTQMSSQILIPSFDADPLVYKSTHPTVLANMHPFYSLSSQGFSSTQFQTMSDGYCF